MNAKQHETLTAAGGKIYKIYRFRERSEQEKKKD
jgi:hypothetical protein